ncbi:hypothetical protein NIES4071_32410 [Calothrix sp. NIES-4071]|nr:hypothetical protein NIES4071_32410 [Calothrix sp. NIES-4071]BAZ57561.1 hypothetical protein NIES4105_32350 [Calothrix sp. NIES-4105]
MISKILRSLHISSILLNCLRLSDRPDSTSVKISSAPAFSTRAVYTIQEFSSLEKHFPNQKPLPLELTANRKNG